VRSNGGRGGGGDGGIAYSVKKLGYVLDDPEFKVPTGASDFSLL